MPEEGATSIAKQLEALMGRSEVSIDEVARPAWMRFGYLSMSKRKPQRLLEPVYVAKIDIDAEEAQGYLLVASAGDKVYMPFDRHGMDPRSAPASATTHPPADGSSPGRP